MQPINAAPRADLLPAPIRSLLQGDPAIEITYGADVIRTWESQEQMANGTFEVDLTGWENLGNATMTRVTSVSHSGSASAEFYDVAAVDSFARSGVILVEEGDVFSLTAWARRDPTDVGTQFIYASIGLYDDVGGTSVFLPAVNTNFLSAPADGLWRELTFEAGALGTPTYTIPAGVVSIRVLLIGSFTFSGPARFQIDDVSLTKNVDSPQYVYADLTPYMSAGSSISSDVRASIHRSCTLNFDSDFGASGFNYLSDMVAPWMTIENVDTGFAARFNLGRYALQTPAHDNSVVPSILSFQGYDYLSLLDTPVPDSYEVEVGSDPVQAAVELIQGYIPWLEVNWTPTTAIVKTPIVYPLEGGEGWTYLAIVNDLLSMVGYLPVWADWEGTLWMEPVPVIIGATPEWTFDVEESDTIVAQDRTSRQDLFAVPNRWRFIMQGLEEPPVEGDTMFTYTDTDPSNPGSVPNRRRTISKDIEYVPVPEATSDSYTLLETYGKSIIAEDLHPGESFNTRTSPFPLAWHWDVIEYRDPNLALLPPTNDTRRNCLATRWVLPLDGGGDMAWVWETISEVL